jgi:hypothetical protein
MQAVVPRRLSLNIRYFCLASGTCSLKERGLVEACVVHIGELVELVCHLTHVVALRVIHLSPLTLHMNMVKEDQPFLYRRQNT